MQDRFELSDKYRFIIQQIGDYEFNNPRLLIQAFTRKSYTEENGGENNEILEFVGDKALDFAVIRYLIDRYGNIKYYLGKPTAVYKPISQNMLACDFDEGELTRLKQKMVQKKALAQRIDVLGLANFLFIGNGDRVKDIRNQQSVKEDLFEAIIGAVAIDSNWNMEAIQNVVEVMLEPELFLDDDEEADYVGLIYEWEAQKNHAAPIYKFFEDGRTQLNFRSATYIYPNHVFTEDDSKYACHLYLSTNEKFVGFGKSKNEARKCVSRLAYKYLEDKNMLLGIEDEIKNPNIDDSINQLETLARRSYFDIPAYSFTESHDKDGNPMWTVNCHINGIDKNFTALSSSKKFGKKEAAYKMLRYVLNIND